MDRIPTDPTRPLPGVTRAEVIGYLWRVGVNRRSREQRAASALHRARRGEAGALQELAACHAEAERQVGLALELARALAPEMPRRREPRALDVSPPISPAEVAAAVSAPTPEPAPVAALPAQAPEPLSWADRLRLVWRVLTTGSV